jgi:hypothetical protein
MTAIHIGTRGYDHDSWQGTFYDPDLPHEWRFDYYCNQFRALLLPWGPSLSFVDGNLDELRDEADDEFRLVLELPALGLDIPNTIEALEALGPRLAGIVFSQLADLESATGFDQVSGLLTSFAANWPLCIDTSCGDSADRQRAESHARELNLSVLWRPDHDAGVTARGGMLVARLGAAGLPRMREVLEVLARNRTGDQQAALFFDHVETAVEQARQCRVLAELMGV